MRPVIAWLLSVLSLVAVARAELLPEEVAILAMSASDHSRKLAEHYAEVRGVPKSQILLLEGKPGALLSREQWETSVQPAIRAWLTEKNLESRIRCFVTCWDVPLRIDRRSEHSPVVVARKRELSRHREVFVKQLAGLIKALDGVAQAGKPAERAPLAGDAAAAALTDQFESALQSAQERMKKLKSDDEKRKANVAIEQVFVAGSGGSGLLRVVGESGEVGKLKPEAIQRIAHLSGRVQGLTEGLQAMTRIPDSVSRDIQVLNLLQQASGALGAVQWVDQQQEMLRKNETGASFDGELSLLHWPDYLLFHWQPNLLHYRYDSLGTARLPTLMVSRLEAPTIELAMKLVDAAIATEKTGLTGKVYLDARGIALDPAPEKRGPYAEYDQSIRDLAERLKKHTKLEVVLENEAKLFQKGDCPKAALYCGWYSLAKYVDAFEWRPGSVGYHIASAEAETLRTPGSTVWCNAMLEHGIGATLGPVFEPYVSAFPPPDDFFSLLLTGRYTLVETYYRTNPFNSWAMVLVGDPLYNPFKKNPPLGEGELPERLRQKPAEKP